MSADTLGPPSSDFHRAKALEYRHLAASTKDEVIRRCLVELAEAYEQAGQGLGSRRSQLVRANHTDISPTSTT